MRHVLGFPWGVLRSVLLLLGVLCVSQSTGKPYLAQASEVSSEVLRGMASKGPAFSSDPDLWLKLIGHTASEAKALLGRFFPGQADKTIAIRSALLALTPDEITSNAELAQILRLRPNQLKQEDADRLFQLSTASLTRRMSLAQNTASAPETRYAASVRFEQKRLLSRLLGEGASGDSGAVEGVQDFTRHIHVLVDRGVIEPNTALDLVRGIKPDLLRSAEVLDALKVILQASSGAGAESMQATALAAQINTAGAAGVRAIRELKHQFAERVLAEAPVKPLAPPVAPPTRPRQIPVPKPKKPGEPVPMIPAKPLVDPKDIQPEDLYRSDRKLGRFWDEIPIGLRRLMIDSVKDEREELTAQILATCGRVDGATLAHHVVRLQSEIEVIEKQGSNKEALLAIIKKMINERYGQSARYLRIDITKNLPSPQLLSEEVERSVPQLAEEWDAGLIHRTELRNLWQQGEGWIGSQEFAFGFASEIDQIVPGLAQKYQELDRLYRLGQLIQLGQVQTPAQIDAIPKEMLSAGREIVASKFKITRNDQGDLLIELEEVNGIAVGRNAWATAHEARKAAAQMATPNEGALRFLLPPHRRARLDSATNSARAEIRQGVFGPGVVREFRKRIALLLSEGASQQITDQDYHSVADRFFSLRPDFFNDASQAIFHSDFYRDPHNQGRARALLLELGVLFQ
jgi:hypothetical protein